ncbi:MAG TPA: glycosyltransferase family 9 protein [Chthoniobacterales bacterium]|jgi:ADP-heptose:LPS heptosyltransferase
MGSRLLIFKVIQLGDNVVFLPLVQELARSQMFSSIELWTTPLAEPLYDSNLPGVTRKIISRPEFNAAWKNPLKILPLVSRVRRIGATHCLIPHDQGNTAHLLALASGIPHRIGSRPHFLKVPGSVTDLISYEDNLPAAERAWALGCRLAANLGRPWPDLPPPPDVSHLLKESAARSFDFLIHPGASLEYQRWLPERFFLLAKQLSRSFRVGWLESEIPLPDFAGSTVEVIRTPDLSSLVSSLAASRVFIGNNSGPMHLASALGVPSLIFCGPSHPIWNPYWNKDRFLLLRKESLPCIGCDPSSGPLNHCTNPEFPLGCMKSWSVEDVARMAIEWINKPFKS